MTLCKCGCGLITPKSGFRHLKYYSKDHYYKHRMMSTTTRTGNYRHHTISSEVRTKVSRFLEENNFPRLISREQILDGIDPENVKGHHRRGGADFTQIRKEISYIVPMMGYNIHCASDKNRVFVRKEV